MSGAGVRAILVEGAWRHRDVRANGVRFHVALGEHFDPRRPLVLLLHGFAQFWWAWRHQIPALDQAGYAVAALDLRGYGASDKTPRGYDPVTSAADVAGVIAGLGFDVAVLVGHDWGGIAAWSTQAYAPRRVRGLALVAAPHPLAYPWRIDRVGRSFGQLPVLPERRLVAAGGRFVGELLRRRAGRADFLTAAEIRRYREALQRWPSPQRALAYQRAFVRQRLRAAGRDYRQALRQAEPVPLLRVHGERDALVPLTSMTWGPAWGPLVSLPGVGHLPPEEAPDLVSAALVDWLGDLGGTGQ